MELPKGSPTSRDELIRNRDDLVRNVSGNIAKWSMKVFSICTSAAQAHELVEEKERTSLLPCICCPKLKNP